MTQVMKRRLHRSREQNHWGDTVSSVLYFRTPENRLGPIAVITERRVDHRGVYAQCGSLFPLMRGRGGVEWTGGGRGPRCCPQGKESFVHAVETK